MEEAVVPERNLFEKWIDGMFRLESWNNRILEG
jgi:hypothetical protein